MARGASFDIHAQDKTQRAFQSVKSNVQDLGRKFSGLKASVKSFAGILASAFVGRELVDTITKFEKLEASLRTVTGSAKHASAAFSFLEEFAAKTPFQLEEMVDAFIKLKALGLTPSQEALTSYGNTAVAMGKDLNQMIEAVADATTGEFERLKEFGIKAKSQGDQVTFTFQGISKTVGKNAREIEGYLRSIGDVQFGDAMKEQAGTLNNALSNMEDAFAKLMKALGDAGLTDILMSIANAVTWLADKILSGVKPFRLGFMAFIAEVMKFGRLFIAVFEGVMDAFSAFGDSISNRFEALGQDLADFIENPLEGVSFDNTRKALETGLVDAMGSAFEKALAEARKYNAAIDANLNAAADKVVAANREKAELLKDMMKPPVLSGGSSGSGTATRGGSSGSGTSGKSGRKGKGKSGTSNGISMGDMYDAHIDTWKQAQEEADRSMGRINDTFKDGITDVVRDFSSLGDVAKNTMSRIGDILLQSQMDQIFKQYGGNLTGIFDGLGGAFSQVLGGGGKSAFDGIASMFGGFFADGGAFNAGKPIIVGERGPELIMPKQGGTVIPNHALGGSSNVNVTMNINTPDVGSFRASQAQIATEMAGAVNVARRRNM